MGPRVHGALMSIAGLLGAAGFVFACFVAGAKRW
jgi:hypothetical protein